MKKNIALNLVILGAIITVLFYIPILFVNEETMLILTEEDGFYESLTAIFFFFAAIIFLYIFIKNNRRNLFHLIFALAFFFAGGEEISWGQRIFHFQTPMAVEAANAQSEFSIHNLFVLQHEHGISFSIKALLSFNRLFILFWIVFCLLVPMAYRYSGRLKTLFERIRLPIVSIWFGALFLFNEVLCKALELLITNRLPQHPPIAEIKESLWALVVLLMGIYFYLLVSHKEEKKLSPASVQQT